MKIAIGYPPLESKKGVPQISQNRQFQWTAPGPMAYFIYPVVPASAATLLKSKGYDVVWLDGLAEKWSYQKWLHEVKKEKPDLIMMETKTPVVKKHWEIIRDLKSLQASSFKPQTILVGDHVTALPEESMKKSKVDYILTGGDYDFLLLNLVEHLTKGAKLEPGVWYREKQKTKNKKQKAHIKNAKILNTGKFRLNHNLNKLPLIDRDLTKWRLYAYKNSNFYRAPGAYTMFGRDCWWGKCTFCLTEETQIVTQNGLTSIKEIVEKKENCKVLTHKGRYQEVTGWHKRLIDKEILEISPLYVPFDLKLTSNHKVYALPKEQLRRCTKKGGWTYWCKPSRISKFLDCSSCKRRYFSGYEVSLVEAGNLKKGDFLAIPVDRRVEDIRSLDVQKVLEKDPTVLKTKYQISKEQIRQILKLNAEGYSQRAVSKKLGINRETVNRYILLEKGGSLEELENPLTFAEKRVSFKWGLNKIPLEIPVNEEFLFLVGLYIAEGHVSYQKNRPNSALLSWTFGKGEMELIERTKYLFRKLFNNQLSDTLNTVNNTRQLYIGATIAARFFKNLFGKGCYCKRIPDEFTNLPLEKQRSLLRGIFKGDAHLRKREHKEGGAEYILETVSRRLAEQVFFMLLRFDVIPSFKALGPRKENESIQYKITLFRKDIPIVFPEIKFDTKKSTYKKGFILEDFALVPIIEIENRPFRGYVYNLTVENDHSYIANFLAVRNCSWTTLYPGKCYRTIKVEKALDEVGHLIENYEVREIMDDSGTFPTGDWLREFCQGMIKRRYNKKVRMNCNMRFNAGLDEEDYQLMGKAGFRFILYGLESASQKTLDKINKNLKVEQIEPVLKWAKKAGLMPHLTVMVGYPWETEKDVTKTISFAEILFKKGLADSLQATIVIPYPGTPLFGYCLKNNLLKTKDWSRYDMCEPIMKTKVSEEKLIGAIRGFFSRAIWNTRFISKCIFQLRSIDGIKYVGFQALKYFGKLWEFK